MKVISIAAFDGKMVYGFHKTKIGEILLSSVNGALSGLYFVVGSRKKTLQMLSKDYLGLELFYSPEATEHLAKKLTDGNEIALITCGTAFQEKVWKELLQIPKNEVITYSSIAEKIGKPTAHRAVANAIGSNRISYLIPCHRVIRKGGGLGGYRFGLEKKKELLALEGVSL